MGLLDNLMAMLAQGQTPWAQQQMDYMTGRRNERPDAAPIMEAPNAAVASNPGSMLGGPSPSQVAPVAPRAASPGPSQQGGPAPANFTTMLSGALSGASQSSNPLGMLLGAIGGGMQASNAVDQRNQTYNLLTGAGMNPRQAALAVGNPNAFKMLQGMQPKETDDLREYKFDIQQRIQRGEKPSTLPTFGQWKIEAKKAGATQVNVGAGETAFKKEVGKLEAKQFQELQEKGTAALNNLNDLDALGSALDQYNRGAWLGSGPAAPVEATVRRFARQVGVGNADTAAASELAAQIQNKMALTMRNPDSGMGMPGAMSDKDREFLVAAQPGIEKTPEGSRAMIEVMRRMENRKIQIANLADQYLQEKGSMRGFNSFVRQWAQANPLFEGMAWPTQTTPSRTSDPAQSPAALWGTPQPNPAQQGFRVLRRTDPGGTITNLNSSQDNPFDIGAP